MEGTFLTGLILLVMDSTQPDFTAFREIQCMLISSCISWPAAF